MASKTGKMSPARSAATRSMDKKRETEAANLAKRKKEFENEKDPKKLLRFQEWSQTDTDVVIYLHAGKKVDKNEISVEYTSNDVIISLTDGRKWYCHFNKPIDMTQSRVQLQKMKVILKMKKAEPGLHWSSYQHDATEDSEPDIVPIRKSSKQIPKAVSVKPKEQQPDNLYCDGTGMTNDVCDKTTNTLFITDAPGLSLSEFHENESEKGIEEIEHSKDAHSDTDDEEEEKVIELDHVKNDFYERGAEAIVAVLYVKQICRDSIQVNFEQKSISVKFRTSDVKFLSLHHGTNEKTSFLWKVDLVDLIHPEKCTYKVTELQVSLTLVKVTPRKWNALEASQAREAQTSPAKGGWQAASTSHVSIRGEQHSGSCDKNRAENLPSTSSARSLILVDSNKENVSQKPTCMVSPLNKETNSLTTLPLGMTGLENLGNTCFLNSVVQVLANTTELRNYFLDGVFQRELNHDNPLGTGGKLAVAFATLMKILWSGKYRSYAPAKLKNLVGMKNSQFMGFAQHDAQEFMAYLLDGLHEDLNRVKNKPYTAEVDSDGRPDEVVANEAWERYKSRNDSFIVDLFQGQYKSKLVCPVCNKVSITFDPFMHLSVPLPRKHKKQLHVIFMSRDPLKKPVKYVLWLSKDATAYDLKELMYQKTGVPHSNLQIFESYKNRIHSFIRHGFTLANFNPRDKIYVCEVLSERLAGEEVYDIPCIQCTEYPVSAPTKCSNCKRECEQGIKLKRCTKCMRTAYCNQTCQKQDWDRHQTNCVFSHDCVGQPFIISLPKSQATFSRIAQMMEAYSRYSLDVFQPPVAPSSQTPVDIPLSPGLASATTSSSCMDVPTSAGMPSSTITQIPSTDSLSSDFDSQTLMESQATSTTEVASTSSDSSFVTVDSGIEHVMEDNTSTSMENNQVPLEVESVSSGREVDSSLMLDCSDDGSFGMPLPPTGYVMGRQQDRAERVELPFSIRPCTLDGKLIPGPGGCPLEDKGDEPLDLSHITSLAMYWKNNEKNQKPYVLVQSKPLECDEDESVLTAPAEESSNITLDQCLSLFTEPEVLSPDHAWYCPQCKEHREATKQLSIWRLPAYLIIQLKRFSFSSFIWRDKIDKLVEYPVRGLDLRKHFVGTLPKKEPPPIYDLYGVVNHMGGILGGHYTSYARCPDATDWRKNEIGWRLFDDSMVSLVSENQVMTRAGYVLFYRRRKVTIPVPSTVENISENMAEEDDNRLLESSTLDEQRATPLSLSAVNNHNCLTGDGDATADNGCSVPSNSPTVYSLPNSRIDMDTVD